MKQLFLSLILIFAFILTASASSSGERRLIAYPNPVERSALMTIELPAGEHGEITVSLFNTVGRLINTIKTNNRTVELTAPDISGIYLLRIIEQQRVVAVEKIIVKE